MSIPGRLLAFTLALASPAAGHAAPFRFAKQTITVPDGFEVELAAGPQLVPRPIVADFDELGRLYVADSSGSNDKVEKQLEEKPHRIVRLEDENGDGIFDRSVVFANRMMFPEGALWHEGSLYVAAPPSIWKLTDQDGDGKADTRAEWFQGKTLTGCANDLHGPYLGPEGWIYWNKGAFAKQVHEREGRPPLVTRAAHLFRARPDGTGLEAVMTGGMDNPVETVFTPGGEAIVSSTFLLHPEAGRRDGLIHAVYGGVFGKVHDVIDEHPRTGDVLPILSHLGPAAVSGLARYSSRAFGKEYEGNLFSACFNLHKVVRHELESDGASWRSRDRDFFVSDAQDFHPTDVLEDADGSLLVIDTGGWYKLCCPTSQLPKPDVLGAIWRVRRKGAERPDDSRGTGIAWKDLAPAGLAKLLGDERPAVRARAVRESALRGEPAVPALEEVIASGASPRDRLQAVWALARLDSAEARSAVRRALGDGEETVRQAAMHSAGLRRDPDSLSPILRLLESGSAPDRRSAAGALGRIGDRAAVPVLLEAAGEAGGDRFLDHAITYALIEIGDREGTRLGLEPSRKAGTRRAALIALQSMDPAAPEEALSLLDAGEPGLVETAWWVLERRPEKGGALADRFRKKLSAAGIPDADRNALERQLARFAKSRPVEAVLLETLGNDAAPAWSRIAALRALAGAGLRESRPPWIAAIARALESPDPSIAREAVAAARAQPEKGAGPELNAALLVAARNRSHPPDLRIEAAAATKGDIRGLDPEVLELLRAGLGPEGPVNIRLAASETLARAKLDEAQLLGLAGSLRTAGPLEIGKVLTAFSDSSSEPLGLAVVAALKESAGLSAIPPGALKQNLAKFPGGVQDAARELFEALDIDTEKQRSAIESLAAALKGGDVRRGQAIFNGAKAACSTCHAIGYLGGRLGPDLTTIGQIRTERDLIEAILFPSMSFTRSYEPVVVQTTSGDAHSGILKKDANDEVVLATAADKEVRIPRAEVARMEPGTVSVMPQGLDKQLTREELADLLAFLKGTRW